MEKKLVQEIKRQLELIHLGEKKELIENILYSKRKNLISENTENTISPMVKAFLATALTVVSPTLGHSYIVYDSMAKDKDSDDEPPNCQDKDGFIDSYPKCCKYPNLARFPEKDITGTGGSSDFFYYDEKLKKGYCFYRNGRKTSSGDDKAIQLPMDTNIVFSTNAVQIDMINKLYEKFAEDNFKLSQEIFCTLEEFEKYKDISDFDDYEECLMDNVTLLTSKLFPIGSIVSYTIMGRVYSPKIRQNEDYSFQLNWWEDENGADYEQPGFEDQRSEYEKFVDDWGTTIQLIGTAVITVIGIFTGFGPGVIAADIAFSVGTSIPIIMRDVDKGDYISAFFGILFMGLSFLQLNGAWRGVSKAAMEKAYLAIKNSGLTMASTQDEVLEFLIRLSIDDPESAKIIKMAFNLDDLTRNILINKSDELGKYIMRNQLREIFKNDINFIKTPFWRSYVAKEIGLVITMLGMNVIAEIVLGRYLNDTEKQKISKVLQIIPKEHQEEYFANLTVNIDLLDEQIPDMFLEDIEKLGKSEKNRKAIAKALSEMQKQALDKHKREYIAPPPAPPPPPPRTDSWYKDNGWKTMEEISNGDFETCEVSDDTGSLWFKL